MNKPSFMLRIYSDNDPNYHLDIDLMEPTIPLKEVFPHRSYQLFKIMRNEDMDGTYMGMVEYDGEFKIC